MKPEIIIALDFPTGREALQFLDAFGEEALYVKVGMELYYSEGPSILREIKARGGRIFLDLKLHDIPNTVRSAMRVLAGAGVDMVNVHAAGGKQMMAAALEGLSEGCRDGRRPQLIAVTQLTSTDERMMQEELLIPGALQDVVVRYAQLALEAGLDGVVCSAQEAALIHEYTRPDFLAVTPGIRFAGDSRGDQKRVMTPARAAELGANALVIGRSITRAADPLRAYRRCQAEIAGA